jgi:hypothetical protein
MDFRCHISLSLSEFRVVELARISSVKKNRGSRDKKLSKEIVEKKGGKVIRSLVFRESGSSGIKAE